MKCLEIEKFFEDAKQLASINEKNLFTILQQNKNQYLGKKYKFQEIHDIQTFQRQVPFSQYDDYPDGNTSAYVTECTLLTSGTSGRSKTILLTKEALKRYGAIIHEMPMYLLNCPAGPSLHTGVFHRNSSKTILSSAYYNYLYLTKRLDLKNYVDGKFLFSEIFYCSSYVKLRLALSCEELISIQSIYLYEIGALLAYLKENWRILLQDMEKNQCSIELPKHIKEELIKIHIPKKRLDALKKLFFKYQGIPPQKAIWPNLAYISGIGHAQDTCVLQLKEFFKDVPVYYFAYASSECMCGVATRMEDDTYLLLPQNAFYEFIDQEQNVILPHEVAKGKIYELVITTFSGLYRYKTGDLLEIVEVREGNPRFRVLGRRNLQLNITGERVDEWTIRQALFKTLKALNRKCSYFVIAEDKQKLPFGYAALTDLSCDILSMAATQFDLELQKFNPNYEKIRKRNLIASPKFLHKKNLYLKKNNLQMKPSLILKEEDFLALLKQEERNA